MSMLRSEASIQTAVSKHFDLFDGIILDTCQGAKFICDPWPENGMADSLRKESQSNALA
jgi:hypothetical protein